MSRDSSPPLPPSSRGTWDIHLECENGQSRCHQLIIGNCGVLESLAQTQSFAVWPQATGVSYRDILSQFG